MLWKAVQKYLKGKFRKGGSGAGDVVVEEYPNLPSKNRDRPSKPSTRKKRESLSHNRPIQLVIGLDFGTSFTKVVVGEARIRYAVPFVGQAFRESAYFLPSALCVLPGVNRCSLGIKVQGGSLYDNLKMPLIERDFSNEVLSRAVAFMALIFRHTRHWLFDAHGAVYKDRKIEWFINVGLPTDSYDDEELTSAYLRVVWSAWHTSVMAGDVTLQAARESLERDSVSGRSSGVGVRVPRLPSDRFNAFPEFAAQLVGYVRSPSRRDGLHVTVDVGGGTLDVTVFNVHREDGEDILPIFTRKVAPLGVRYLSANRTQRRHEAVSEVLSPFANFPSDADFRKMFRLTKDEVRRADRPFRGKVEGVVAGQLLYTRRQRYPGAPQWCQGKTGYGEPIPGFFCGGGVLSEFYGDLLRSFKDRKPPFRVCSSQLPIPDDLEAPGMTSRDYARLAVAYGLSFDPYDISPIRRMDEIEDVPGGDVPGGDGPGGGNNSTYEDRYIGKEQV